MPETAASGERTISRLGELCPECCSRLVRGDIHLARAREHGNEVFVFRLWHCARDGCGYAVRRLAGRND